MVVPTLYRILIKAIHTSKLDYTPGRGKIVPRK